MQYPYTPSADIAFAASQLGTAALLAGLLLQTGKSRSRLLMIGSVASAAVSALAFTSTPWLLGLLALSGLLGIGAWRILRRPRPAALLALTTIAVAALHRVTGSNRESTALQLLLLGAHVGFFLRAPSREDETFEPATSPWEKRLGVLAFAAAALVSVVVFRRFPSMDDEWAYTYQADVFAHLRAWAPVPRCSASFESLWIYSWEGRRFTQFTPGWPLALAPLATLGAVWLGSPAALGLLAIAVSRLGCRCVPPKQQRRASVAAPLLAMASASALLNGGSRFAHVFVAALLAWAVESACALRDAAGAGRPALGHSLILGSCVALLPITRPGDGLCLAPPVVVWSVHALWREGRARALLPALASAGFFGLLALVILRLQIGTWFRTGYALTPLFQPWAQFGMSPPKPTDLAEAVPLGAIGYCFFPCAPALGAAGLVLGRARGVRTMLGLGVLALVGFYAFVEFTRVRYWGYGPRYHVPLLVPLSVGGAVVVARITRRALTAALIATTVLVTIGIGACLYPVAEREAYRRGAVERAIERRQLTNAVVTLERREVGEYPEERTHNLGIETPPVLVVLRGTPADRRCLNEAFPGRRLYRALGHDEVTLVEDSWP